MKIAILFLSCLLFMSCTKSIEPINTVDTALKANATIAIDVRSQAELDSNPAPGAIHIPLANLTEDSRLPSDKSTPILVFCEAGGRAERAKVALITKGYSDVKNITDWRAWNKLQAK